MRNKRELNARLKGATLGDADGDADDTLKWIKRSKKKEKELAKKRQEELESRDRAFQDEYTESEHFPGLSLSFQSLTNRLSEDLAGLKVSHDFEELAEGEDRILTLKDSRILDNEGRSIPRKCENVNSRVISQRMSYRTSIWRKTSALRS